MFGQPIADIACYIGMARQIDAVSERRSGFCARGDDGKVEDRKRYHEPNLVRRIGPTKGGLAQVRGARTRDGQLGVVRCVSGLKLCTSSLLKLPTVG